MSRRILLRANARSTFTFIHSLRKGDPFSGQTLCAALSGATQTTNGPSLPARKIAREAERAYTKQRRWKASVTASCSYRKSQETGEPAPVPFQDTDGTPCAIVSALGLLLGAVQAVSSLAW